MTIYRVNDVKALGRNVKGFYIFHGFFMLYNDRNTTTILATLTKEREDKYMERILCLATWIVFFLAIKNVVTFNVVGLIICLIVQIVLKAKIRKIRKEKKK